MIDGVPAERSAGRSPSPSAGGYVGRFAPSPTGALHLGSLVAALGSYLDARHNGGRWLVRMEDLDTPRVVPGCSAEILRTLELFGLHWDGEVEYQSRRTERYAAALETLKSNGLTFECSCSRREFSTRETPVTRDLPQRPGAPRARPQPASASGRHACSSTIAFRARVEFDLRALGDPVVRRRDGVLSYQLAVVVDDAQQGISDVVRGADLLDSTAWQIALQRALGLATPRYAHLPLIVEPQRGKLAKSRHSLAIAAAAPAPQLIAALQLLQHPPPAEAGACLHPRNCLHGQLTRWKPQRLCGLRNVTLHTVVARTDLGFGATMVLL